MAFDASCFTSSLTPSNKSLFLHLCESVHEIITPSKSSSNTIPNECKEESADSPGYKKGGLFDDVYKKLYY